MTDEPPEGMEVASADGGDDGGDGGDVTGAAAEGGDMGSVQAVGSTSNPCYRKSDRCLSDDQDFCYKARGRGRGGMNALSTGRSPAHPPSPAARSHPLPAAGLPAHLLRRHDLRVGGAGPSGPAAWAGPRQQAARRAGNPPRPHQARSDPPRAQDGAQQAPLRGWVHAQEGQVHRRQALLPAREGARGSCPAPACTQRQARVQSQRRSVACLRLSSCRLTPCSCAPPMQGYTHTCPSGQHCTYSHGSVKCTGGGGGDPCKARAACLGGGAGQGAGQGAGLLPATSDGGSGSAAGKGAARQAGRQPLPHSARPFPFAAGQDGQLRARPEELLQGWWVGGWAV